MERFDEIAQGSLDNADLTPELNIDGELTGAEVSLKLASEIENLSPFGMGNPEPVFMARKATVIDRRILKERHLKFRLALDKTEVDAIGFNMADSKEPAAVIDVAFCLGLNSWNGRNHLQLRIRDFRDAE